MSLRQHRESIVVGVFVALVAVGVLLGGRWHNAGSTTARGLSAGQSSIGGGGGGISRVTNATGGILSGSGTASNPETATITVGGIVSGTGSSGSPIIATEVGDISGVTAGSGLTGGGASGAVTLAVNVPATSCSNGQAVTSISAIGTVTCGDAVPNNYGGTHLEWNDEFIYGITSLALTSTSFGFFVSGNGGTTGTLGQSQTAYNTRPGMWEMATGTNAAGRSAFSAFGASTATFNLDASQETITIAATVGFPVLSTSSEEVTFVVGTGDNLASANQTDGCVFLYDRGNVATSGNNSGHASVWECSCANNGSRTIYRMDGVVTSDSSFVTVNAPITAMTAPSATNIDTLKLVQTSAEADFYYHGTLSCKITTNLPGASTRSFGVIAELLKTTGAGATSTLAEVDRMQIAINLNSARSP